PAHLDLPSFPTRRSSDLGLPTDFLGLNIYTGRFIRAGKKGHPGELPLPRSYPEADSNWLKHVPQAMYWGPRLAQDVYGVKAIYIDRKSTRLNSSHDQISY